MKMLAANFLRRLLAAILDKEHKVLTNKGAQFGKVKVPCQVQVYAWRYLDQVCD
jgi:hypothetical protein